MNLARPCLLLFLAQTTLAQCPISSNCSSLTLYVFNALPNSSLNVSRLNLTVFDLSLDYNETLHVETCQPGYYSPKLASACLSCSPGYFSEFQASSACLGCGPGTFSLNSFPICSVCALGFYAPSMASACVPCPAGTSSELYFQESVEDCEVCSAGTYSFQNATVCLNCLAGYSSKAYSSSCFACWPGSHSPVPASPACLICGSGYFSPVSASTFCGVCEGGRYSLANASGCLTCPAGSFSLSNSSSCTLCSAGKFSSSQNSSTCGICQAGLFSLQNSTACASCPLGYYSYAESGLCTACDPGTFSRTYPGIASWVCEDCQFGRYSPGSAATACLTCQNNTYAQLGYSQCLPCPDYSDSLEGSSLDGCICRAGYRYSRSTSPFTCAGCGPGTWSFRNSEACAQCVTGKASYHFLAISEDTCQNCSAGTFTSDPGSPYCLDCLDGTFAQNNASTFCQDCQPGSFSDRAAPVCTLCLPGKHNPFFGGAGIGACLSCQGGYFSGVSGASLCGPCERGTFSLASSSLCSDCPPNTFSEQAYASCVSCPEHSLSNARSRTNDCLCVPGYRHFYRTRASGGFEEVVGLTLRTHTYNFTGEIFFYRATNATLTCASGYSFKSEFQEGTFLLSPASTCSGATLVLSYPIDGIFFAGTTTAYFRCEACAAGSSSNKNGSQECPLCLPGTEQPFSAETSCSLCAPGYFAPTPGTPLCPLCQPGFVSESAGMSYCAGCERGTRENGNRTMCLECLNDTYSNGNATNCSNCTPNSKSIRKSYEWQCVCQRGYFNPSNATKSCPACRHGTASNVLDSYYCAPCGPGRFSLNASSSCSNCAIGSFQPNHEASACSECAPGTQALRSGAPTCEVCPIPFYCTGGDRVYSCPQGTYTNQTGLTQLVQCQLCFADYFCATPREIEKCPDNTHSEPGSLTILECICEPGFICTYQKQLHASVTLPVTQAEFELIRQEFINTMAAAAGVDPSKVQIVGVVPVGRRLLSAFVKVHMLVKHATEIRHRHAKKWELQVRHMHTLKVERDSKF